MASNSLNMARVAVNEMIEQQQIPTTLVGEIGLEDLIHVVASMVEEGIKEHLRDLDSVPEERGGQYVQDAVEQIAFRVALVIFQAAIQEITDSGLGESEPDVSLGVSPDTVTAVMSRLLSGEGVSIKLVVEP